jgi:hypothetical protein
MHSAFTKALDKDEQNRLKSYYEAWELLIKVLKNKREGLNDWPAYDNGAWAYKQAHTNGLKQSLDETIHMLQTVIKD